MSPGDGIDDALQRPTTLVVDAAMAAVQALLVRQSASGQGQSVSA